MEPAERPEGEVAVPRSRPRRFAAPLLVLLAGPLGHVAVGYWRRACAWYAAEVLLSLTVLLAAFGGRPTLLWSGIVSAWLLRLAMLVDVLQLGRAHPIPRVRAVLLVGVGATLFYSILAVKVRAELVEAFMIPSGSMYPTLEIGDHLFVRKGSGAFRRGDVVVHRYPLDPATQYVKRIVAVGGDVVAMRGGHLEINGRPIDRRIVDEPCVEPGSGEKCTLWEETLDGRTWRVAIGDGTAYGDFERTIVPPGRAFVLGDNRNNSSDSRVWGAISLDLVQGEASFIWLPARGERFWRRLNQPIR